MPQLAMRDFLNRLLEGRRCFRQALEHTWCGHDDIRVGGQLGELGFHGVPAHQDGCAQAGVATQLCNHLVSLQGQLPGGRHDDCPGPSLGRVLLQPAGQQS